jgi:hypothetical protein
MPTLRREMIAISPINNHLTSAQGRLTATLFGVRIPLKLALWLARVD